MEWQEAAHAPDPEIAARQRWMRVLAKAGPERLEAIWAALAERPAYDVLRPPEVGLVMVRGRAGGAGQPFNLGEMTMTRCAVRIAGGAVGHGHVAGRQPRQAELAAVFDALLLDPARRPALEAAVVAPLERALEERRQAEAARTAATRVEFFTMVRGD
jgi:alpha-D-ribose 1-methylphosphonate 5-triphosphate synthase subunit PhnG